MTSTTLKIVVYGHLHRLTVDESFTWAGLKRYVEERYPKIKDCQPPAWYLWEDSDNDRITLGSDVDLTEARNEANRLGKPLFIYVVDPHDDGIKQKTVHHAAPTSQAEQRQPTPSGAWPVVNEDFLRSVIDVATQAGAEALSTLQDAITSAQTSLGERRSKDSDANVQNESADPTLHPGVTCDGCEGAIRGARFKCMQCPDYDLCASCEARALHQDHPMIRIAHPGQRAEWPMHGLRMYMRQSYGHCRGGRGGCGWGRHGRRCNDGQGSGSCAHGRCHSAGGDQQDAQREDRPARETAPPNEMDTNATSEAPTTPVLESPGIPGGWISVSPSETRESSPPSVERYRYQDQVDTIRAMGFYDEDSIRRFLERFQGRVEPTVGALLTQFD